MTVEMTRRYADLLAAYGSDVSRWPEGAREEFRAMPPEVSPNELQTERLLEYRALDRLLHNAARKAAAVPPAEVLVARIASAATQQQEGNRAPSGEQSDVVAIERVGRTRPSKTAPTNIQQRRWAAAAALMAASLVLGIFLGSQETVQSTAERMGILAGLNIGTQTIQTSALDDALQIQDDEELL
jgi:hypothetical protein